jgi:hypothetical protein
MLEKGVVLVLRDEFEGYFKTYLSEEPRNFLKKVAEVCFNNQASAVVLFINKDNGIYRCSCYSPIYESVGAFEQCAYDYKDIDDCIYLDVFFAEDAKTLMDSELFFTIKEMAIAAGYWREEHAALVHR